MIDAASSPETLRGWTFGEAVVVRASALVQLVAFAFGLGSRERFFRSWGLPYDEPATFSRVVVVTYGVFAVMLFRVIRVPRKEGVLALETIALYKLALTSVVWVDAMTHKLTMQAVLATVLDATLGAALF